MSRSLEKSLDSHETPAQQGRNMLTSENSNYQGNSCSNPTKEPLSSTQASTVVECASHPRQHSATVPNSGLSLERQVQQQQQQVLANGQTSNQQSHLVSVPQNTQGQPPQTAQIVQQQHQQQIPAPAGSVRSVVANAPFVKIAHGTKGPVVAKKKGRFSVLKDAPVISNGAASMGALVSSASDVSAQPSNKISTVPAGGTPETVGERKATVQPNVTAVAQNSQKAQHLTETIVEATPAGVPPKLYPPTEVDQQVSSSTPAPPVPTPTPPVGSVHPAAVNATGLPPPGKKKGRFVVTANVGDVGKPAIALRSVSGGPQQKGVGGAILDAQQQPNQLGHQQQPVTAAADQNGHATVSQTEQQYSQNVPTDQNVGVHQSQQQQQIPRKNAGMVPSATPVASSMPSHTAGSIAMNPVQQQQPVNVAMSSTTVAGDSSMTTPPVPPQSVLVSGAQPPAPKHRFASADRLHTVTPCSFDSKGVGTAVGLGKVFYFLDQMKLEVTETDKTMKELQNDMKFLREKNKELEAKNNEAERRLAEEKAARETAEAKVRSLKKKLKEFKESVSSCGREEYAGVSNKHNSSMRSTVGQEVTAESAEEVEYGVSSKNSSPILAPLSSSVADSKHDRNGTASKNLPDGNSAPEKQNPSATKNIRETKAATDSNTPSETQDKSYSRKDPSKERCNPIGRQKNESMAARNGKLGASHRRSGSHVAGLAVNEGKSPVRVRLNPETSVGVTGIKPTSSNECSHTLAGATGIPNKNETVNQAAPHVVKTAAHSNRSKTRQRQNSAGSETLFSSQNETRQRQNSVGSETLVPSQNEFDPLRNNASHRCDTALDEIDNEDASLIGLRSNSMHQLDTSQHVASSVKFHNSQLQQTNSAPSMQAVQHAVGPANGNQSGMAGNVGNLMPNGTGMGHSHFPQQVHAMQIGQQQPQGAIPQQQMPGTWSQQQLNQQQQATLSQPQQPVSAQHQFQQQPAQFQMPANTPTDPNMDPFAQLASRRTPAPVNQNMHHQNAVGTWHS